MTFSADNRKASRSNFAACAHVDRCIQVYRDNLLIATGMLVGGESLQLWFFILMRGKRTKTSKMIILCVETKRSVCDTLWFVAPQCMRIYACTIIHIDTNVSEKLMPGKCRPIQGKQDQVIMNNYQSSRCTRSTLLPTSDVNALKFDLRLHLLRPNG